MTDFEINNFTNYEAAKAMEEIGFDEPCIAHCSKIDTIDGTDEFEISRSLLRKENIGVFSLNRPLFTQATGWFFKQERPICFIERYNFVTNLWSVEVTQYEHRDDGKDERGYWVSKEIGCFSAQAKYEAYNAAIIKACELVKSRK